MDLTPDALANLRRITDTLHARNVAELSELQAKRQTIEHRIAEVCARRNTQLADTTQDSATIVAAQKWVASADPLSLIYRAELEGLDEELAQMQDRTRTSLAKTEACNILEEKLQDGLRMTESRAQDRATFLTAQALNHQKN